MNIVFSPASKNPNCSGFFFSSDPNAPSDAFPVSDFDHMSAVNLEPGYTFSFIRPVSPDINGTLVVTPPNNNFLLEAAKNQKLSEIFECYSYDRNKPLSYTSVGGVTSEYQADINSVDDLQSLLIGLNAHPEILPPDFFWVALDNTQVPFVYADLQNLAQLMLTRGMAAFSNYQSKKVAVRNAKTVSEAQSIIW